MGRTNSDRELTERRNVSLYPRQWAIVEALAIELDEPNISAALRRIVNDWAQFKQTTPSAPQGTVSRS